ncbi:hypothetical protein Pmar_PMAR002372 [Perkinsus marinus ATCC 50983]|uniref:Uncharacterized protein n=1 Tax=Perkinsus marinus (strain ATCC 50983 / TXsc) TaxID=423536 RepID=C5LYR6_PERM5|nr:hypothetical protein Pmar_PMAR002372 [Perkinsus marinus ATCC 50983]XP_002765374.1 hypothetical protein Pmar_PMAR002372 [Perkinsus marinus ATCC 50983]XP_002765375.1 hypothetical protein Pmar_PMAR002372 [Perkinsus marinus ATCC 50983]EEQ98090.1 hypothetical protein Pmar_PMAR002372 [Perkinsus marinus ATCC 50983]EEQ98091.1 hypothetical protein Pmar_PMAR002372 [Perkinsus marinus ATCC 50983]EEQ98092.1 hypothetical protein Pmar_PMAR002372 [Perkinsus marinus ATCC 50983]|eukprot:XP_002765373.1 hypothetical protein Pmar_PMAR002372 [Perkinsus marinus ATCC 50983]
MLFNFHSKSSSCKLDSSGTTWSRKMDAPRSPISSASSLSICSDGILRRSSGDCVDSGRMDRRGHLIHDGSKSHSISFADEVEGDSGSLENVFIVESFKAYYTEDEFHSGKRHRGCFSLRGIF